MSRIRARLFWTEVITGSPENVREAEEEGKKVEVWTLRRNKGTQLGYWSSSHSTFQGSSKTLRFIDGSLEEFDASTTGGGLKLDD